MGRFKLQKSILKGQVSVPASKSHTLRAILFSVLGNGKSIIRNFLSSSDASAMIQAGLLLGAKINVHEDSLEIEGLNGEISGAEDVIHAGNSGIVLRFISALAGLSNKYIIITGDHSIRHQRPIQPLLEALNELGVQAISSKEDGYAPVIIRGPFKQKSATINGEDSQPVSALLIALAFRNEPSELNVKNPGEKPWIMLTLHWLDRLGIGYENHNFEHYKIYGNGHYQGFEYTVPGDLSTAAFPIAAALITDSELTLNNIDMQDIQGDKELIYVLQRMGANIEIDAANKTITVKKGSKLKGMEVDINTFIDAVPILAVLACYASGETRIINAGVARQKECDRLHAITTELQKMGASITELSDSLIIQSSPLKGASVYSHHDHRMVMSLSVAALGAEGETVIQDTDCVAKTYPNFARDFQKIGAHIQVEA